MSLLRPVIRACAVAALRDKSWAQSRVYDSDMTPLAAALQGQQNAPYIVVYTDADDFPTVAGQAEIYDPESRRLQLTLEIGVASAIKNGTVVLKHADFASELAVDIVASQAMAALIGDPHSQWGEIFKRFIGKVFRVTTRRGGAAQGGIRFAARRIVMQCNTHVFDFAPGIVPREGHPIYKFIETAQANPLTGPYGETITDMANTIAKLITTDPLPDWRQAQALLGLTRHAVEALNVPGTELPWPDVEQPPLDYTDQANEFAPEMTDIKLDADVEVSDGEGVLDPPQGPSQ